MKQKIFLGIVVCIAVALFIASYFTPNRPSIKPEAAPNANPASSPTPNSVVKTQDREKPQRREPAASGKDILAFSLSVRGKEYSSNFKNGDMLLEAMRALASTTTFRFNAELYPGMGYFVYEINGIKNTADAHWILYINGNEANVGAGSYTLRANDKILWRYENSSKQEVAY